MKECPGLNVWRRHCPEH